MKKTNKTKTCFQSEPTLNETPQRLHKNNDIQQSPQFGSDSER